MTDVLLITGGRADWGLLKSPARLLRDDPRFSLRVLATGSHLDPAFGTTVGEIEADGFEVDERIPILAEGGDDAGKVTQALARATSGIGEALVRRPCDLIMLLGDRYEILGAASAALVARIPVAHICGGDLTEGAIDDAMRHAITKMSHLHFVTNEPSAARVRQMGEDPTCVFTVGSPGLDGLLNRPRTPAEDFRRAVGLPPDRPLLVVTFHPPTLDDTPGLIQFAELTEALDALGEEVVLLFTGSNADEDGRRLTDAARAYAATRGNAIFRESLGHELYFAALDAAAAVVGNSSSGVYEAPSFGIPTVDIGSRQAGRLKAASVIEVPPDRVKILDALHLALAMDARGTVNPYGDGRAGERIVEVIAGIADFRRLLHKRFHAPGDEA